MLADLADDFKTARRTLLDLAERSDMTEGSYAEDAVSTVRRVRLELDAMDQIGWPNDPAVG